VVFTVPTDRKRVIRLVSFAATVPADAGSRVETAASASAGGRAVSNDQPLEQVDRRGGSAAAASGPSRARGRVTQ
jgi:hypothetical protein